MKVLKIDVRYRIKRAVKIFGNFPTFSPVQNFEKLRSLQAFTDDRIISYIKLIQDYGAGAAIALVTVQSGKDQAGHACKKVGLGLGIVNALCVLVVAITVCLSCITRFPPRLQRQNRFKFKVTAFLAFSNLVTGAVIGFYFNQHGDTCSDFAPNIALGIIAGVCNFVEDFVDLFLHTWPINCVPQVEMSRQTVNTPEVVNAPEVV